MQEGKKIYFASDFHLGAQGVENSNEREKLVIDWLCAIQNDAQAIYLLGDIFDFWFEYKYVVPKNYVRLFAKLAELKDKGIEIFAFTGNHDMWTFGYWEEITGMKVFHQPIEIKYNNVTFYIGHGDGLGPGDHGYKLLKKVFRNPVCQWLFWILPPYVGVGLANYLSRRSRAQTGAVEETFLGEDKEWLIIYCKEVLQQNKIDFFVFGHRHLPIDFRLSDTSRYINLGDWIRYFSYAAFDGEQLTLEHYKK